MTLTVTKYITNKIYLTVPEGSKIEVYRYNKNSLMNNLNLRTLNFILLQKSSYVCPTYSLPYFQKKSGK